MIRRNKTQIRRCARFEEYLIYIAPPPLFLSLSFSPLTIFDIAIGTRSRANGSVISQWDRSTLQLQQTNIPYVNRAAPIVAIINSRSSRRGQKGSDVAPRCITRNNFSSTRADFFFRALVFQRARLFLSFSPSLPFNSVSVVSSLSCSARRSARIGLANEPLVTVQVLRYGECWTAISRRRYSGQVVSRNCGCRGQQIACFRASLHHSVTLLTLAGNPSAYLV